MHPKFKELLAPYLPPQTIDQVVDYIIDYKIQLRVTRGRRSKLGDYRSPQPAKTHRITINGTLGPYYFYLVFLHELAHLLVWQKYRHKVSPHGKEWKSELSALLNIGVSRKLYPGELEGIVSDYAQKVTATYTSCGRLWKYINGGDRSGTTILESVPLNSLFLASNGKVFRKEEKVRKKFRCYCIDNSRRYLFHPFAPIKLVDSA